MSKTGLLVIALLLGLAAISFAQEPAGTYTLGGMVDPYAGPTPPGMRFGDAGQVVSVQTGDIESAYVQGGCSTCRFGVPGAPCDPAWGGPCIDWKLVGWYSNWHDKQKYCGSGHGCRRCGKCRTCSY